ncbi:hypothetical protein KA405_03565 [Patescibacteria group bacterium]|nr:hypothetical protein [Patescibacteria group bacterium]
MLEPEKKLEEMIERTYALTTMLLRSFERTKNHFEKEYLVQLQKNSEKNDLEPLPLLLKKLFNFSFILSLLS